jgi:N-hydroxyarylamine O-acetyltransferase
VTEDGGRITLSGRALTTTASDGTKETKELGSDEEVLRSYREHFGVELAEVPTVRGRDRDS